MYTRGTMTERERIEALLNRKKPDRVPIWPFAYAGFSVVYANAPIACAYNRPEISLAAQRKACLDFGWVFTPLIGYAALGAWEFGGHIKWPYGEFSQAPAVTCYPVETPDDVMNLKLPDIKNSGLVPIMMEFYKIAFQERLDNEPFNVTCFPKEGAFTTAANIPGPENFVRWLIKKPETAHYLLRLASDYLLELAKYWRDTFGTDGVLPMCSEPMASNQIISPRFFEQFALPYLREVNQKVLAMGYKTILTHICGEQNANLPYWAQVPMGDPGIVSIGHEIDLETAARYFPNDIIYGNLNPTIIQVMKPDDVYKASRKIIEKGKKLPGGFIFSSGCEMPPKANAANVMAMTMAVNDFGWYK